MPDGSMMPDGDMPPEQQMLPGMGGPPPQGGMQMGPQTDPNLGPGAQDLTPELLAMMMAVGSGGDPSMAPPPEMLDVPPPWA